MKFSFIAVFLCAFMALQAQIPYRVIVPTPGLDEGTWVYMSDIDKSVCVDSAQVADHHAVFRGDVDEPYMVAVSAADKRYGILVLEQGTSTINQATGFGVGTMLNDCLKAVIDSLSALEASTNVAGADKEAVTARRIEIEREAISDNSDNPIGFFLFMDLWPYISPDERQSMLAAYPELAEYETVKRLISSAPQKSPRCPGCDCGTER